MSEMEAGWRKRSDRLLRSARLLLEDGDVESAVSRAYYAMFFAAEALLARLGLSFSSHHAVIGAFGREFAKAGRLPVELHRFLIDAVEARNLGDYQVRSGLVEKTAAQHIESAERFVEAAAEWLRREASP